jgi:hypothetical protein
MGPGAQTPEELETLFEDAFVVRDRMALVALFEDGAVLSAGRLEAQGGEAIAGLAGELWERELTYLADPHRVVQARDSALVLAAHGINVLHRGDDGAWRYSISLLTLESDSKENR